jgi:hypothetical protein
LESLHAARPKNDTLGCDLHGAVRVSLTRRRALSLTGQEAFAAKYRTSLGWFEWDRGLAAALRAGGHGFALREPSAARALALGLARLATLRFILEVLVVEEMLFSRCEDKIRSAVYALKGSILKLRHGLNPRYQPEQLVGL